MISIDWYKIFIKTCHFQLKDGRYLKENALIMADVFHMDDFDEAAKARKLIEICAAEGKSMIY